MIINYSKFGDVVSFDTIYKINKEHRPFAVFVGFGYHRVIVVFGAALMYDETAESFTWLFETFLEAMSNKPPKTILIDQDAIMAKVVSKAMPYIFHKLCKWHILQNAIKNVNLISPKPRCIKGVLAYFMENVDDKEDFVADWEKMKDEYNVRGNKWLDTIFGLRGKWAHAYVRLA
ncbi:hypothetical protein L1049_000783 [Liquidambar formosana]|uniref:MULE transposase domain-containing protein n=1 Tax=Liquidambar formosana TaxID=63359 RepID=A0AAP0NC32_LIQFO